MSSNSKANYLIIIFDLQNSQEMLSPDQGLQESGFNWELDISKKEKKEW